MIKRHLRFEMLWYQSTERWGMLWTMGDGWMSMRMKSKWEIWWPRGVVGDSKCSEAMDRLETFLCCCLRGLLVSRSSTCIVHGWSTRMEGFHTLHQKQADCNPSCAQQACFLEYIFLFTCADTPSDLALRSCEDASWLRDLHSSWRRYAVCPSWYKRSI